MIPLLGLTLACAPASISQVEVPLPMREFRGVWVATVDNIDWPSKRGIPTEQAMSEMRGILDKAQMLGFNAIILQVRPHADALYDSKIEPWSEYLTGAQGKAPEPTWDPLDYAIQEAHKRGMELHAWFNPYRAWHPAAKGQKASNYIGRTNPGLVKTYGVYEWMDPSEPDVQKRSLDVMMDVVKRYDLDGVHIDDYFYPYKVKDTDFPDGPSWKRYKDGGGPLDRGDFRRKSVDDFIQNVYGEIKKEKPWVKFGISPFGIYRPGQPAGIKAGVDQYADLYADCLKWFRLGWCDYLTPQLYWPIKQTPQAYPTLLSYWAENNPMGRHLWPGNYSGRTDPNNGNWSSSEVVNQIKLTREKAGGNIHFSMKCFMKNWNGISDALLAGPYSTKALPPASPWLDSKAPGTPVIDQVSSTDSHWNVSWKPADEPVRFYVIATLKEGIWKTLWTSSETSLGVRKEMVDIQTGTLAITAIDRTGNASKPLIVELK
ncbi:MAG: family 10 glycosylhydrolase [Fimbriimonadaceae bacterium]